MTLRRDRLLLEYVKLIIEKKDSGEKYLKRTFEPESSDEKILMSHNLTPIQSSEGSHLGRGAYANAYEVLYKGRRAAAKIIQGYRSNLECEAYIKIKQLKTSAPPIVARHLPSIYETIYEHDYSIIVMEILQPLTSAQKSLWGVIDKKDVLKYYEHDPDKFAELFAGYFEDNIKKILMPWDLTEQMKKELIASVKEDVANGALTYFFHSEYFSPEDYMKQFKRFTVQMNKFYEKTQSRTFELHNISHWLSRAIKKTLAFEQFPIYGDEPRHGLKLSHDRQAHEMDKTIEWLLRYVSVQDLHHNNVMSRKNGTLVISDVGLFTM